MGMNIGVGGKAKVTPQMNVTPLVDIVLVLLIIFMVVTPMLTKQFYLVIPEESKEETPPDPSKPPIVLRMDKDGSLTINSQAITKDELSRRLTRMFVARGDTSMIFDAAADANYGEAVVVMDIARAAGAVTIAVSPEEIK